MDDQYRNFRIRGENLTLTAGQAALVKVFWMARLKGMLELVELNAMDDAGLRGSHIRDLFRSKVNGKTQNSPNYEKLFRKGKHKDMYCLNLLD